MEYKQESIATNVIIIVFSKFIILKEVAEKTLVPICKIMVKM